MVAERRHDAFRQLLVAANALLDAAYELRAFPKGRQPTGGGATVSTKLRPVRISLRIYGRGTASYRLAEPDLVLDPDPIAAAALEAYDQLWRSLFGYRILVMCESMIPAQKGEAMKAIEDAAARLRGLLQRSGQDLAVPAT